MPSLQEIEELGTAAAERTIRESKALDYAWMADQVAMKEGKPANQLHDLINRFYTESIGALDVSSSPSDPGANPGS